VILVPSMELPTLGKHCAIKGCSILDFLPYTCDRCSLIFCQDHRTYDAHRCGIKFDRVVPECPLCGQVINVRPGEDVNAKVDAHMNAGCPQVPKNETKKFHCTFPKCEAKELQRITCPLCSKDFCIKHRHPSSHTCASPAQTTAPQPSVHEQFWESVSKRIQETMKKFAASDNPRAKQAALMNMKQKATGSPKVAMERRVYLEVIFPMDSKVEPKFFFFDQEARFGVVLDIVAEAGRIKNQNNIGGAKKLQLISLKTGTPFALNTQLKSSQELSSGDSILLEFAKVC